MTELELMRAYGLRPEEFPARTPELAHDVHIEPMRHIGGGLYRRVDPAVVASVQRRPLVAAISERVT